MHDPDLLSNTCGLNVSKFRLNGLIRRGSKWGWVVVCDNVSFLWSSSSKDPRGGCQGVVIAHGYFKGISRLDKPVSSSIVF
jgi:hypothetical protein